MVNQVTEEKPPKEEMTCIFFLLTKACFSPKSTGVALLLIFLPRTMKKEREHSHLEAVALSDLSCDKPNILRAVHKLLKTGS